MALRGNLRDFGLPDVFQLIQLSRKSGVLRIKAAGAEGAIWFRDGDVFFAQSNWRRELLGQRLVAAGKITPSALARALEMRGAEPPGGRRLGQILVDEGYITQQVLEAFVQEQIQDTIFDIMRWDEGQFDFEILPEVIQEDIGLAVSVENIVMEASRRLEEWDRIRKRVPSTDMVFRMATAPGEGTFEISLTPAEWNLLLLMDGTRSVRDLAIATRRTDFEVARMIYGLFSAGLLEVADPAEVERRRADRVRRERARLRRAARGRALRPTAEAAGEQLAGAPLGEEPSSGAELPAERLARGAGPVEVPEFLARGGEEPSVEDLAEFEHVLEAVLAQAETAAPSVAPPQPTRADTVEPPPASEPAEAEAPETSAVEIIEREAPESVGLGQETLPEASGPEVPLPEAPEVPMPEAPEVPMPETSGPEVPMPEERAPEEGELEATEGVLAPGAETEAAELPATGDLVEPEAAIEVEVESGEAAGLAAVVAGHEALVVTVVDQTDLEAALPVAGDAQAESEAAGARAEAVSETTPVAEGVPYGAQPVVPPTFVPTGDLETDLLRLGLGELPEELRADREEGAHGAAGWYMPEGSEPEAEPGWEPETVPAAPAPDEGVAEGLTIVPAGGAEPWEAEGSPAAATTPAERAADGMPEPLQEPVSLSGSEAAGEQAPYEGAPVAPAVVSAGPAGEVPGDSEAAGTAQPPRRGLRDDGLDVDLGLAGGLGDELMALTGAASRRPRPAAKVEPLPAPGERPVLRRDAMLDRALILQIIDGIERL